MALAMALISAATVDRGGGGGGGGGTGEWPVGMSDWRWYHGPLCTNCHMSPLPIECMTSPTPSIRSAGVELTGLSCTSVVTRLTQDGRVM